MCSCATAGGLKRRSCNSPSTHTDRSLPASNTPGNTHTHTHTPGNTHTHYRSRVLQSRLSSLRSAGGGRGGSDHEGRDGEAECEGERVHLTCDPVVRVCSEWWEESSATARRRRIHSLSLPSSLRPPERDGWYLQTHVLHFLTPGSRPWLLPASLPQQGAGSHGALGVGGRSWSIDGDECSFYEVICKKRFH